MKPEHEKYILENVARKPPGAIAKDLGLKERKVKRFLERQKEREGQECRGDRPVAPASSIGKRKVFLSVILIALLGFAVYANSIGGAFIWDDSHLVEDNLYLPDSIL